MITKSGRAVSFVPSFELFFVAANAGNKFSEVRRRWLGKLSLVKSIVVKSENEIDFAIR